mmetsp:Transcript_50099/g.150822  ORF Transcript_50099/g.150822 Transcript_50099/m.150822 type:complete len:139 (+) Transcript_50099:78-494(+)
MNNKHIISTPIKLHFQLATNDRLGDLYNDYESQTHVSTVKRLQNHVSKSTRKKSQNLKPRTHQKETEGRMDALLREVGLVKASIVAIQEATSKIRDLTDEASRAVTEAAESDVSRKLHLLVADSNKDSKQIKVILTSM